MRIIVFSDSHGDVKCMDKAIAAIGSYDALIHLGDIERDVLYLQQKYSSCPVYGVLGNNDFYSSRPKELVVDLGGVNFFLCHGHTMGVLRGTEALLNAARARGCTAALFGHTHVPVDKTQDGVLIFNPGSCRLPRSGRATFGVIEIENKKCSSVIVDWIL